MLLQAQSMVFSNMQYWSLKLHVMTLLGVELPAFWLHGSSQPSRLLSPQLRGVAQNPQNTEPSPFLIWCRERHLSSEAIPVQYCEKV